jgi:hypothetical protein
MRPAGQTVTPRGRGRALCFILPTAARCTVRRTAGSPAVPACTAPLQPSCRAGPLGPRRASFRANRLPRPSRRAHPSASHNPSSCDAPAGAATLARDAPDVPPPSSDAASGPQHRRGWRSGAAAGCPRCRSGRHERFSPLPDDPGGHAEPVSQSYGAFGANRPEQLGIDQQARVSADIDRATTRPLDRRGRHARDDHGAVAVPAGRPVPDLQPRRAVGSGDEEGAAARHRASCGRALKKKARGLLPRALEGVRRAEAGPHESKRPWPLGQADTRSRRCRSWRCGPDSLFLFKWSRP